MHGGRTEVAGLAGLHHIVQGLQGLAHDMPAESPDASLNSIAKRAGVGPGTLYRHFPTREALILEVHRHDVGRLVGSVPDVLAAHAPLDALRQWFTTLAAYVRIKHGLGEALHSVAAPPAACRCRGGGSCRSRRIRCPGGAG